MLAGYALVVLCVPTIVAMSIEQLHGHYNEIFPTQNRNAASHKWATYVFKHATSANEAERLFQGFCPVSGSPLYPVQSKTWRITLPMAADLSSTATGLVYFCCSPCVCDANDFVRVDTYTYKGVQLKVLVVGDPCVDQAKLFSPFTDPFSHEKTTLHQTAPEVACTADGKLSGATFSDNGYPIIGMLFGDGRGHDAAKMKQSCDARAKAHFNSGMGYIFHQLGSVHQIKASTSPTPTLPAIESPSTPKWHAASSAQCGQIDEVTRAKLEALVNTNSVLMIGLRNARCTNDAESSLEAENACSKKHYFSSAADPLWSFLQCMYPQARVGSMKMHSYVFVGRKFIGDGFVVKSKHSSGALAMALKDAQASLSCSRDTSHCNAMLPVAKRQEITKVISQNAVVLYGWSGCPCTSTARTRFTTRGVCYVETVWPSPDAAAFKYLQCIYGEENHSFLFFKGVFKGNGFILDRHTTSDKAFDAMLTTAHARLTCQKEGDKSLIGGSLKSCTQSSDGSTTGWTRTGSCNWDPSDGGYHEVCVTMSDKFLRTSATEDGNDLSSVVQAGGHWCICAWAFASAVQRDPTNLEGIVLDCERTNEKLINVYEAYVDSKTSLRSPSGKQYQAYAPLRKVQDLCPRREPSTTEEGRPTLAPTRQSETTSPGARTFRPAASPTTPPDSARKETLTYHSDSGSVTHSNSSNTHLATMQVTMGKGNGSPSSSVSGVSATRPVLAQGQGSKMKGKQEDHGVSQQQTSSVPLFAMVAAGAMAVGLVSVISVVGVRHLRRHLRQKARMPSSANLGMQNVGKFAQFTDEDAVQAAPAPAKVVESEIMKHSQLQM